MLEKKLEDRLSAGFARKDADSLALAISDETLDADRERSMQSELESNRTRDVELEAQIDELRTLLAKSDEWLHIEKGELSQAISCGLELIGTEPLHASKTAGEFLLPNLSGRLQSDPSWMHTLDTLRAPQRKGQPLWDWRKEQPVRPVVFSDQGSLDGHTVHLHLEHRFVQRLLGRFRSQGFVRAAPNSFLYSASRLTGKPASCSSSRRQHARVTPRQRMKVAHSRMCSATRQASVPRTTVCSLLRAGPKWKFDIHFLQPSWPTAISTLRMSRAPPQIIGVTTPFGAWTAAPDRPTHVRHLRPYSISGFWPLRPPY